MAAALVAKEADFRLLAEECSDVVMRIGLDARILYASPSCARIFGWDPAKLLGTPALAGINSEDRPRVQHAIDALKSGEAEEARIVYRTRHREEGRDLGRDGTPHHPIVDQQRDRRRGGDLAGYD